MKIVVPERVVEVALSTMHKLMDEGLGVGKVSTEATITAALQEWIASGEAREGAMYEIGYVWYAQTLQMSPGHKPVLIIRMEPDND